MGEDSLRNRKDNGSENMALMRKLALNLARITPTEKKQSMRGKLKRAGWDNDFLLKLVSFASSLTKDVEPGKTQTRYPCVGTGLWLVPQPERRHQRPGTEPARKRALRAFKSRRNL